MMRIATVAGLAGAVLAAFAAGWLAGGVARTPAVTDAHGTDAAGERDDASADGIRGREDGAVPAGRERVATRTAPVTSHDSRASEPPAGAVAAESPAAVRGDAAEGDGADATAELGRAPGPAARSGDGRVAAWELRTREGFPERIREALGARKVGDASLLEGEREAAVRAALRRLAAQQRALEAAPDAISAQIAAEMATRVAERARLGSVEGEVEIVLQTSGDQAEVSSEPGRTRGTEAAEPIAVSSLAVASRDARSPRRRRTGGVPPFGSVIVLDRITIAAAMAPAGDAEAWFEAPLLAKDPFRLLRVPEFVAVYRGAAVWDGTTRPRFDVGTKGAAAAEIRLHGRVLPAEEAPPAQPFLLDLAASSGYLRGGVAIRLQAAAGRAKDRRTSVRLDGSTENRAGARAPRALAGTADEISKLDGAVTWTSGAGRIPPGHTLVLRRVVWRLQAMAVHGGGRKTRFDGSAACSLLDTPVFAADASRGDGDAARTGVDSGVWNGHVVVRPGQEERVSLEVADGTFAEAVLHGTVEPDR